MSIILGILLTLVVFLIVVLVHEWGHFITARKTGMKVEEFGFGIPPRITKIFTDREGTDFTINWLPIGGFVRILGEDPTGPDAHKKGAFMTRPWWARAMVLVAGVTMNFVLAWVIFFGLFLSSPAPLTIAPLSGEPTGSFFIPSFTEAESLGYVTSSGIMLTSISGSVAEQAGVGSGDILVTANGQPVSTVRALIDIVKTSHELTLVVDQSGAERTIQLTPRDGKVGMYLGYKNLAINPEYHLSNMGILGSMQHATRETYASTILTFRFLGSVLHGLFAPATPAEHTDAKNMLSGPIGIGGSFVTMIDMHVPFSTICLVIALLSINLGVVNILPLPALDGGRLLSTTVYSIFSRYKKDTKSFLRWEQYIHALGFALLLAAMIYVAGLDIGRFFG